MQLDYYVYGDFQSVVNAFHMVANLFSNHTYQSWFTVVMLLTIAAFAFQATAERIFGAKASDAIWIKRVMIGTVLYSIFMVPTITLHIYDPFKNKYEAVGGIPAGVGLIAGMTSGFTREISELIETAGSPIIHIDDIGFGNGYEMLSATSALGSIGLSQDQYLTRTLADYFDKCIIQMNASGDLDFDALWNGNGKTILENIATDYRIFSSTVWTSANPGGALFQCADAYQHIVTQLTQPARVDKAFRVFCSKVNYNPTDATEFMMCRQKFRGVYEAFSTPEGFGYNETSLFASAVVAEMYLTDGLNAGVERAKEIARSMATASDAVSGAMAADFMPMIQGMVATILISLFVIVALLMYVAPMDAFKFYFGLWIWFLTWVLVDVVINMQVQNYAYEVFREIRETSLSLTTMFSIGDRSAQVLGWYSKARWMSMTIASMMTYGIFKFGGGAAFASFAGALGASYSGQAASQGAQIGAPGGEAAQYKKTLDDLSMVPATTMGAVNSRQWYQSASTMRSSEIGQTIGQGESLATEAAKNFGGNAMDLGRMIGSGAAYNQIKSGHSAAQLEDAGYDAERVASGETYNTMGNTGAAEGSRAVEKENGLNDGELLATGGVGRNLKYFTDAKFRENEANESGESLLAEYQKESNIRTVATDDGILHYGKAPEGAVVSSDLRSGETGSHSFFNQKVNVDGKELTLSGEASQRGGQLTVNGTDEHGNAYSISGLGSMNDDGIDFSATSRFVQSKEESMRGTMFSGFIDTDGDGKGDRYTDISFDTATGLITARRDGKNFTFKGDISDYDAENKMISISPGSEVSWTAQYKDVQVRTTDGKYVSLVGTVEASGTGMPGDNSMIRLKGQTSDGFMANIEGKGNVLRAAHGDGHVLNGLASVSRLEKTATKDTHTRESDVDEKIQRTEDTVEKKFVRATTESYVDDTQVKGLAAVMNNPYLAQRVVNAKDKESIAEASIQTAQAIAPNLPTSLKYSVSDTETEQNVMKGGISGQGSATTKLGKGENQASGGVGINAGMELQKITEHKEGTSQDKDPHVTGLASTIYSARLRADELVADGKIEQNDVDDYIASRITDYAKETTQGVTGIKNERYIPDYASGNNPSMHDNNDIWNTATGKAFKTAKEGFETEK
ncbi:MAG: conjugal transfer protein TraG N-terminal domain-containing protein [Deferribacterales bacterium]